MPHSYASVQNHKCHNEYPITDWPQPGSDPVVPDCMPGHEEVDSSAYEISRYMEHIGQCAPQRETGPRSFTEEEKCPTARNNDTCGEGPHVAERIASGSQADVGIENVRKWSEHPNDDPAADLRPVIKWRNTAELDRLFQDDRKQ